MMAMGKKATGPLVKKAAGTMKKGASPMDRMRSKAAAACCGPGGGMGKK